MVRRSVPFVLAIVLIATGFTQLHLYNVTWDEALGDLFFGQRSLSYLLSLDPKYLDFDHDPYPAGHVPDLSSSLFSNRPWEYWTASNTLADATSRIVSNGLHIVDPFDGFHAFNLLAGALLLIVLYRVVERETSTATAVAAVSTLFLMPRVVCDLMANIKDFPEMVFFSLTVLAFFTGYERGSWRALVFGAGIAGGLAAGTKANAWFVPLIVLLYIALRGFGPWRERGKTLLYSLLGSGAVAFATMLVFWPYVWAEPFTRIMFNINYVTERAGSSEWTINGWFALVTTTPPIVLAFFAAGAVIVLRRALRRDAFAILLVVWFGVIAARIGSVANFDGVRHFLEILPPIAIVAAIGAIAIAKTIADRVPPQARSSAFAAVVAIPIATTAWATIATHPFETTYWNAFVGGYRGAQQRKIPQACDYWAASYRLGLDWLDAHAPRGSALIVPVAGHTVRLVAPLRLRHDIELMDFPAAVDEQSTAGRLPALRALAARKPLFVMFVPRPEWSTDLDRDCMRRLSPAHEWTQGGAPVLLIYRYQ